jgi:Ca2+-binding RTX toxin-like protein
VRWALLFAVVVVASAPGSASAAVVQFRDAPPGGLSGLDVYEVQDEVNDITLTLAADGRVEIHDAAAPIDARTGCEHIDEHRARCPIGGLAITVQLGAENDRYQGALPAGHLLQVFSGPGDDTLLGGPADESLSGGLGADVIRGGDGDDSHAATIVYDGLDPGAGSPGARITLDGQPDDGLSGEGDNVFPDVENIHGTPGPDTIIGTDASNDITGGGGEDVLQGMGGNDRLTGTGTLSGGLGRDVFMAFNGHVDTIICGGGVDWVEADQIDHLDADCPQRFTPGVPFTYMPAMQPAIARAAARSRRSRYAPVRLVCPPAIDGSCRGELTLRGTKRVGRRAFSVSRGKTATVRVPLTTYGRRLLARRPLVRLAAQIRTASGQRELPVFIRTRRR